MFSEDDFNKKVKDGRQMKALLWVKQEELNFLTDLFSEIHDKVRTEAYEERKQLKEIGVIQKQVRRSSKWNSSILDSGSKKLFFLLYYLKTYPTYDVLGFTFWMDRSTACVNIHRLLPVLMKLFRELGISPKREIYSMEDLKEAFDGNILDLIVDGTERRYFRHKDYEQQKENYSGKKSVIPRRIPL